jgi:uncharacterized membrane protein
MISLIAASAFFLLIHFTVSGTSLRDVLVARLGEGPYRGLFSLASVAGIYWMASAYARAPTLPLWSAPAGARPLALVVTFIAVLYVVIGLAMPSPTSVGMEGKLAHAADSVRGITRITRHPFLWGVGLWALVHLLMNGDVASLILFGSLLLLALGGTAAIDAKRRRRFGEQWSGFARVTSNVPFAAIAAGRNQLAPALREIGLLRVAMAIAVYALLLIFHGRLFGPPLI